MATISCVGELPPQCAHHHAFFEVPVCWPQSALPSVKSHTAYSQRAQKRAAWSPCPLQYWHAKRKRKNWLATFEMLPSSDPAETVIAMVSGQAVWALVASQRVTTILFIHSPGLQKSPLGCSLSGCAVSRALLFLIKEKQGNSHAPPFTVWMLRLSLTQVCMHLR